jgi:hypothetical protein
VSQFDGKTPILKEFFCQIISGQKETRVGAFEAGTTQVTNGEYHAFVAAGGYHEQRYVCLCNFTCLFVF